MMKEFRKELNQTLDSLLCFFDAKLDIDQETRANERNFRSKIRDIKKAIGVNPETDKLNQAWLALEKTEDSLSALGNPELESEIFGKVLDAETRAKEKENLIDIHEINASVTHQIIKMEHQVDITDDVNIDTKELSKKFLELGSLTRDINLSSDMTNNLTNIYDKAFNLIVTYQKEATQEVGNNEVDKKIKSEVAETKRGKKVISKINFESFGIKTVAMTNLVNLDTTPFKAKLALGWGVVELNRKQKIDGNITDSEYIKLAIPAIRQGMKKLDVHGEDKKEVAELLAELTEKGDFSNDI